MNKLKSFIRQVTKVASDKIKQALIVTKDSSENEEKLEVSTKNKKTNKN